MEITLKNYRCFPDSRPAHFDLRKGFTALVGVNNSGKSSLLKFFHEFRALFQFLSSYTSELRSALMGQTVTFGLASIFDVEEIFCNANDRDLEIAFLFPPAAGAIIAAGVPSPTELVVKIPRGTNTWLASLSTSSGRLDAGNFVSVGTRVRRHDSAAELVELSPMFEEFKALADTFYVGPFRNAINVASNANYFDIQIGQAFINSWRNFKTGPSKQSNELILRVTDDIKRVFEFEDLQIDSSNDGQTLQVFINRRSYKLPELGSGLAQFVLALGNAAIRQPTYILIDEPELNLHPSLMLDFLTTLGSYARAGIIFGTHNMGLARGGGDRIYSLRKIAVGESELTNYEETPRLSEFLGELSFSGYRELGFDRILLVEGPTDVKTIQQLLRMYKMDHHIVLLPLGGSSLINASAEAQLVEIKRISPRVSALIDSERTAPGARIGAGREGFVEACRRSEVSCHVLDRRAIENYFPDAAVERAMGSGYRALQPYQKLSEVIPAWSKSENWRIAREMSLDDLGTTDLRGFLDSLYAAS